VLRENHRFIRDGEEVGEVTWEERLARAYESKLFKEFALVSAVRCGAAYPSQLKLFGALELGSGLPTVLRLGTEASIESNAVTHRLEGSSFS
jgi:hypothetical protein